ncbi:MAG: class B sortase [Clostridia bacterium]|nr:class B sortase [Clostridia bacterium]
MRHSTDRRRKRRLPLIILFILFFAIMVFSGYKVMTILLEYKAGTDTYENLEQYIVIDTSDRKSTPTPAPLADPSANPEPTPEPGIVWPKVDFESLWQINDDVVGWIYIEGTTVNYPIVQGQDNDYYLYRMIDGEYNTSGSIFMDCRNGSSFTDRNTILYGHHMNNGSMFSDLLNYKEQSYFDEHPVALIMTPEKNYTLEFFTGYVATVQDNAWDNRFASDGDYANWLRNIGRKSRFYVNIVPEVTDRVVTLSTCSYEFDDARFVVCGVLRPEE